MRKAIGVLLGGLFACATQAQVAVGDWSVGQSDDGEPYIATFNESGGLLGKWCDHGTCFWMYANPTNGCESGARYPALVNSDLGAATITMVCSTPREIGGRRLYRQLIQETDALDQIAQRAKLMGIALPMQGDAFKAVRFSMSGASEAFTRFRGLVERAGTRPRAPGRSTRDVDL